MALISNTVKPTNSQAGLLGLTPAPKSVQPPNPLTLAGNALSGLASLATPFGGAKPLNQQSSTGLASPQMSTIQPSGATALGGTIAPPKPAAQASLPVAQPQQNAIQSFAPQTQATNPAVAAGGISSLTSFNQPPAQVIQPQQSSGRGLFSDVASSLAAKGSTEHPATTEALADAKRVRDQLTQSRQNEATAIGRQGLAPIPMGDITGRQAVIRNQYLAQQNALSNQLGADVQLGGLGNTIMGTQQSALSSAGNLAAPQVTGFGQTSFDPTMNTFGAQGGGYPPEVMQHYAQLAATGQYAGIPSAITSNPVLNAQLNVAAKALNPSYTPIGAQGASGVLQGIPALQSANTAAEGIKNQVVQYLQANPQLNPSDLAAGNKLQMWIEGKQLTDPKYQVLANYLNEYTNTLAPILGVGGDPTNLKTQIAASFINAAASGQSIAQVLDAMSMLATNKIQDLQNGAVGAGTSVPAPGMTGGYAEVW